MINGERMNVFFLRLGIKQKCLLSLLLFNIVLDILPVKSNEGKVGKGLEDWRRSKTAFTHMIIYIENLMKSRKITSPGWMHETSARTWCTGKTQRDRVEREVGGGIGMGNTCISKADSCQCMTKTTTI